MNALAASMSFEAAYAVPGGGEGSRETAESSPPSSGRTTRGGEIEARLAASGVEWLKLRLTPEEANAVRRLDLPGIGVQETPLRYYPNGSWRRTSSVSPASTTRGLKGSSASLTTATSKARTGWWSRSGTPRGGRIPGGIERRIEPAHGYDLVLTIDKVIQYIAEREIERGVLEADADWGVFLGVNPKTGEDPGHGPLSHLRSQRLRRLIPPRRGGTGPSPTTSSQDRRSRWSP